MSTTNRGRVQKPPEAPDPPALKRALAELAAGRWPVAIHPYDAKVSSPGKAPIGNAWGQTKPTHESLRATWKRYPNANVGLKLGAEGGVIDIDVDDPGLAAEVLSRIFPDGIPKTRGWANSEGRHHLLFLYDPRLAKYGKAIIKGVLDPKTGEVRGNAAYLGLEIRIGAASNESKQIQTVIPPSLMGNGAPRKWNEHAEILPVPEALIADLDAHAIENKAPVPSGVRGEVFGLTASQSSSAPAFEAYIRKAIDAELSRVESAPEGARNESLNRASFALGQLVGAGAFSRAEAESGLSMSARRVGLGQVETLKTIESGLTAGIAEPRDLTGVGRLNGSHATNGHSSSFGGFGGDNPGGNGTPKGSLGGVSGVSEVPPREDPSPPGGWGEPRTIRNDLPLVARMVPELLPPPFRPWLNDIAERVGCALDFVAAASIVALGSLIGRRLGIRPKRHDDWKVIPNLWGAIVGRPGWLKSPAVKEVMKPIYRLQVEADERFKAEEKQFAGLSLLAKAQSEAAKAELQSAVKKKGTPQLRLEELAAAAVAPPEIEEPTPRRYVVNDATVEKLAMILCENPNGVLVFRDELMGWLRSLDKQGRESDRQFYLEAWNGDSRSGSDRVGRGRTDPPALCVSLLGTIQPGPLAPYLRGADAGTGEENDGLISRFQLLVYPDSPGEWKNVDRWPDTTAKNDAYAIFRWIDAMDPASIGAEPDEDDGVPFLRFSGDAQAFFDEWRYELENNKLHTEHETPLIESHLSKYRSLMPSLALVFHVADVASGGDPGPVSLRAAQLAAAWCDYLESHIRRILKASFDSDPEPARRLAEKIKAGELPSPFTTRQVSKRDWSGLTTPEAVDRAVACLERHGWVYSVDRPRESGKGGRPTEDHYINPRLPRKQGGEAIP